MPAASRMRWTVLLVVMGLGVTGIAAASTEALEAGFVDPPASARPRVWWHWMNGNVTEEGITADLEWMKRVGIGGMTLFDADLGSPVLVPHPLPFFSPEWKAAVRHAAAEAARLGLEMSVAASPGWSETGGPFVAPDAAMKKLVWSEVQVRGGRKLQLRLPSAPDESGPFQNVLLSAENGSASPKLYHDIAVFAFRAPTSYVPADQVRAKVTSSAGTIQATALCDGDYRKRVPLAIPSDVTPAWVLFDFGQPQTLRALTESFIGGDYVTPPTGLIEASVDGTTFRTIASLPGPGHHYAPVRTHSFPATTARYFRVTLTEPEKPVPAWMLAMWKRPAQHEIAELCFTSAARIDRVEEKAGYGILFDYDAVRTPEFTSADVVDGTTVIDISSHVSTDGTLHWQAPRGEWIIQRFGYSLTGKTNGPARPAATGLEVDKLNASHVQEYLEHYLEPILSSARSFTGKAGLQMLLSDSWEAGQQNWTERMLDEFQRRRGYDLRRFLPVLTGWVVDSADTSERVLWDFRRTIADLIADNHYAVLQAFAHRHELTYTGEAMGVYLPTVGDGLLNKSHTDIPMGEFWALRWGAEPAPEHVADIREAASAAHIYGQNLVGAESFGVAPPDSGWSSGPWQLKWVADKYLAYGVNRFMIHTSVHQPFVQDRKPGLTLWNIGQHFTRNETWAEAAGAWTSYLARCAYLLQQGTAVADLAYFYGEGAPVAAPFAHALTPAVPAGYSFDYVGGDAVLRLISVKDGEIVLPSGMNYRVLVIPDSVRSMTLPMVRKLRALIGAGATVVAPKPLGSPSHADDDADWRIAADELWGDLDGTRSVRRELGRGVLYWGLPLDQVLAAASVPPDFDPSLPQSTANLLFAHRRDKTADIYFVSNQTQHSVDVSAQFRVGGREAELWHPDTRQWEPASYVLQGPRTAVPLQLAPLGSVFVVFRKPAGRENRSVAPLREQSQKLVQGPWTLNFPQGQGAPVSLRMDTLSSWTQSHDLGVRYFSGTVTYLTEVQAPAAWFATGALLSLDLGDVREIAEVRVNGSPAGTLWKPPFRADVTSLLRPGANQLEVRVTNFWRNRLVGDAQPDAGETHTFATSKPYEAHTPLVDSGLLGPVKIIAELPGFASKQ